MPAQPDLGIVCLAPIDSKEGSDWLESDGGGGPFQRFREGNEGRRDGIVG
jgi:hypothetical protein